MCVELGQLAQGFESTKGTNTCVFMTHEEIDEIPTDQTVTYAQSVVDYQPQKADLNRVHITAEGNLINNPEELTTRTLYLRISKILWNSVLCTKNAKHMCIDTKNMYLATLLERA